MRIRILSGRLMRHPFRALGKGALLLAGVVLATLGIRAVTGSDSEEASAPDKSKRS